MTAETSALLFLGLIAAVSLLLGYIGATVGLVLGQLRVALLIYALGDAAVGTATSLAISTAGTLIGTLRHAVGGRVQLALLLTVGAPSAAAAFFTARYAHLVDARLLKLAIAGILIVTGGSMLVRREPKPDEQAAAPKVPPMLAEVAVGTVLGAISGLVGLLLGSLRLPAMIRYARVPTAIAIGTNMAIGTLTGLSAGVATFLEGQVDLRAFAVVAPATVIGAHLGAGKTGKLAPETLRAVIAWVLVATGLLMLGEGLIRKIFAP
ncbi:MAG TPA: sulfite exporter TauE/SafE family protein [Nannocystis sp.]